ncbi:MAG: DUF721 domain-containing protein [Bacteroidetes bacterium]|nr:DUF721 domain-containing protein [Bacteroidota bacterium]MCY4225862.1 DUF721 domain-containing protein [Bacteroidota bacterium]
MRSQTSPKPLLLSNLIDHIFDDLGIRQRVDEAHAVEAWHQLAGPVIATVTEHVWARQGRLYVELNSGTWRQELHMHRIQWKDRLNQTLGKKVIHEIVFN